MQCIYNVKFYYTCDDILLRTNVYMYTNVLKTVVEYHISRGSHVFSCFVDFNTAFDRVNYWRLFTKLLNDGVTIRVVLVYWRIGTVIRLLL